MYLRYNLTRAYTDTCLRRFVSSSKCMFFMLEYMCSVVLMSGSRSIVDKALRLLNLKPLY